MIFKSASHISVCARVLFLNVFGLTIGSLLTLSACGSSSKVTQPVALAKHVANGEQYMGIRILGALHLSSQTVDGLTPSGLSGLAWDKQAQLLYAVSDRGNLFHLRPRFNNDLLVGVAFVAAYALRDAAGAPLKRPYNDAEGLAIRVKAEDKVEIGQLLVSFERKARVARYSSTGRWLGDEPLPDKLQDANNYASPNKALEAVTLNYEDKNKLLVAPERPMRGDLPSEAPIFASDGQFWRYPLFKAPNSAVVAMETLTDGSLLILERAFVSIQQPLIITLRRTALTASPETLLTVENMAVLDSSQQWRLDNFEGLAHHVDNYYFMVSDDNYRASQKTLLVYFELLPSFSQLPP